MFWTFSRHKFHVLFVLDNHDLTIRIPILLHTILQSFRTVEILKTVNETQHSSVSLFVIANLSKFCFLFWTWTLTGRVIVLPLLLRYGLFYNFPVVLWGLRKMFGLLYYKYIIHTEMPLLFSIFWGSYFSSTMLLKILAQSRVFPSLWNSFISSVYASLFNILFLSSFAMMDFCSLMFRWHV